MHAIANNNIEMVKFLLGRQENGNKTRYSNPRRTAPHSNPALHFNHDALDFARWHKGRIDDKIIKLVEEAWEACGPYENDGEIQRNSAKKYRNAVFAVLTPIEIIKDLNSGLDKKMRIADYMGLVKPHAGGGLPNLFSVPVDKI